MWPDYLLGVVPQPTDSRLSETIHNNADEGAHRQLNYPVTFSNCFTKYEVVSLFPMNAASITAVQVMLT